MTLSESLCYYLASCFLGPLRRFGSRTRAITRFDSNENYFGQRAAETSHYRKLFSPFVSFEGKTVLELGCNRGYLLHSFLQHENFEAIGADIHYLEEAKRDYGDHIKFVQSTPTNIPLPSSSVDVVYTIDTIEHLSKPKEILSDVFRVLRPGGIVLVHFNPWLNPHGHHLEDIITFPWPHAIFSMRTLLNVAEKLYDSPLYPASCYFMDGNGNKKPNPYKDRNMWNNYLNFMTIKRFNQLLRELPFEVRHQERIGFGGSTFKLSRTVRGLAKAPVLTEYFTSVLFTVLVKAEIEATGRRS